MQAGNKALRSLCSPEMTRPKFGQAAVLAPGQCLLLRASRVIGAVNAAANNGGRTRCAWWPHSQSSRTESAADRSPSLVVRSPRLHLAVARGHDQGHANAFQHLSACHLSSAHPGARASFRSERRATKHDREPGHFSIAEPGHSCRAVKGGQARATSDDTIDLVRKLESRDSRPRRRTRDPHLGLSLPTRY